MFDKQKTKKDCYVELKNACVFEIAKLEVEIKLISDLPEDTVVGERETSQVIGGIQGKTRVTAKELLQVKEFSKQNLEKKLAAIEYLIET